MWLLLGMGRFFVFIQPACGRWNHCPMTIQFHHLICYFFFTLFMANRKLFQHSDSGKISIGQTNWNYCLESLSSYSLEVVYTFLQALFFRDFKLITRGQSTLQENFHSIFSATFGHPRPRAQFFTITTSWLVYKTIRGPGRKLRNVLPSPILD